MFAHIFCLHVFCRKEQRLLLGSNPPPPFPFPVRRTSSAPQSPPSGSLPSSCSHTGWQGALRWAPVLNPEGGWEISGGTNPSEKKKFATGINCFRFLKTPIFFGILSWKKNIQSLRISIKNWGFFHLLAKNLRWMTDWNLGAGRFSQQPHRISQIAGETKFVYENFVQKIAPNYFRFLGP